MRKYLIFNLLFLSTIYSFGQDSAAVEFAESVAPYLNLDSIKTFYSEDEIDKLIVGEWKFEKVLSPNGEVIPFDQIDSLRYIPIIVFDIQFDESRTYTAQKYLGTGKWGQGLDSNSIILELDSPYVFFPPYIKEITDDKQMLLDIGVLDPISKISIEICKMNESSLFIIERSVLYERYRYVIVKFIKYKN